MRIPLHLVPDTVFAFCLIASAASAAEPVNPIPRAVKATTVHTWDFQNDVLGWKAENQCSLTADREALRVQSTGEDPYMHTPVDLPGGQVVVRLRMRSAVGGPGQVFWTSNERPRRDPAQSAGFAVPGDGQWHEAEARFTAPGRLADLRVDPGVKPGLYEIDWIHVVQEELHPLTISSVVQTGTAVRFTVTNHRDTPVTFESDGASHKVDGNQKQVLEKSVAGNRPLEPVSVAVRCESWPDLNRTVWAISPDAPSEWIEDSFGPYKVNLARDGSLATIYHDKQLVATLGPLVTCDGKIPALELTEDTRNRTRFAGDGVRLVVNRSPHEIQVEIISERDCEGPVVRVLGGLEQGLFAGLEYLGKGEHSSTNLDIETEEHIRFAPDPLMVTMPLMAFVTDRVSVAMTWDSMSLQPVYATPNFFDGAADHRMSLEGREITAVIRINDDPLEESIAWAATRKGLPPLPPAPRDGKEQDDICMAALNGPLKTQDGWGHCVQPDWKRQPHVDMASTVWRLTGEVPQFDRFVPGGAHVPNGTLYFVTGRAEEWLEQQRRQVRGFIARQQSDGSYRYDGKFARGHFEDTASGYCALPAARLLDFAYVTGDQEALAAGLRTLEYMKRFSVPRGAQTWEIPLHTPDQLASAYLVWAYTRGYQLTDNAEYLSHARKWALSGVPFTYMWSRYPIMLYATPPVYGATNWIAPNWMGLPVQWVGGVYAYALSLLAPHEKSVDWEHIARGILISAQQQQYPDGPHIGLLPDSFNIPYQRRQPADINPCAIVSLQMAVDGEVDFLSVAVEGQHRVAAPFRVTMENGVAHVDGRAGVTYQMIVDGTRVVEVQSKGRDAVPLQ